MYMVDASTEAEDRVLSILSVRVISSTLFS